MKTRTISLALMGGLLLFFGSCSQKSEDDKTYHSIRPGEVWLDTNGNPIQAHGFQVFYQDGTYYW